MTLATVHMLWAASSVAVVGYTGATCSWVSFTLATVALYYNLIVCRREMQRGE